MNIVGLAAATMIAVVPTVAAATMINVGIPGIIAGWSTDPKAAQWLSSAFLASLTLALPASAWVTNRFGVRRVAAWTSALLFFSAFGRRLPRV